MPCATRIPGAAASIIRSTLAPRRCVTYAPVSTPKSTPPQIPRPPCQIAIGPYHWSPTSFQLVMSW